MVKYISGSDTEDKKNKLMHCNLLYVVLWHTCPCLSAVPNSVWASLNLNISTCFSNESFDISHMYNNTAVLLSVAICVFTWIQPQSS